MTAKKTENEFKQELLSEGSAYRLIGEYNGTQKKTIFECLRLME